MATVVIAEGDDLYDDLIEAWDGTSPIASLGEWIYRVFTDDGTATFSRLDKPTNITDAVALSHYGPGPVLTYSEDQLPQ